MKSVFPDLKTMIVILFVFMLGIVGTSIVFSPRGTSSSRQIKIDNFKKRVHAQIQEEVSKSYYVVDSRTDLCFAVKGITEKSGFTNVPCTSEVRRLAKHNE